MRACSGIILAVSLGIAGSMADQTIAQAAGEGAVSAHPVGDSVRGKGLYEASCVVCHGPNGSGGIGPKLAGNVVLGDEQAFWKVVYEGRHVMPPLKGAITGQQMADIRAWLKTLR